MPKIYLTCPECGCCNWIVRDDEEAEGAFECGACGDLVFTEDMGAEVEEDASTPGQPLIYAMGMFINAAVTLSDVISASDAEELVSVKYPFNKSFDELIWDIREWKEAVLKEEAKKGRGDSMKTCDVVKELFTDWNRIEKGEWSRHGRIIDAINGKKIEIGLYREPADTEYNGTLTLQIFCNDDVVVCEQVGSYEPEDIEELWDEFGNVPMNPETEKIESSWNGFPAGTDREDIWKWFDKMHPKGVHYLLYER